MAPRLSDLPSTLSDRIRVEPNGCWRWMGTVTTKGYGQVSHCGRREQAHRVTFSLTTGQIPEDHTLDHLCRHRWCVNPEHLQPVTNHENVLRGLVPSANRELCLAERHDISSKGAIYLDSDGCERCRQCRLESKRRYRQRLTA